MDRAPEEMQFLGLFGIYVESYKIIISWRKIFSQITLALILPLSFIFLARIEVSRLLFSNMIHNEIELHKTSLSPKEFTKISNLISSERTILRLFKFFYFTFFLVLSLLSTSAVVYTIASAYTAREVNFKKVMSVVPKVWKRLVVTFLCAYCTFFLYNIFSMLILILWGLTIGFMDGGAPTIFIILILYLVGFVYLAVVWQLASVVSVLEEFYGFKAMMKSKDLIKGKTWIAAVIFFKLVFSMVVIISVFEGLVVDAESRNLLSRLGFGFLCLLVLCKLFLFTLVINTVIYFVCKSYHHESIDKSILSDHLEVYLGDYVPLKAKDVQLEQLHV